MKKIYRYFLSFCLKLQPSGFSYFGSGRIKNTFSRKSIFYFCTFWNMKGLVGSLVLSCGGLNFQDASSERFMPTQNICIQWLEKRDSSEIPFHPLSRLYFQVPTVSLSSLVPERTLRVSVSFFHTWTTVAMCFKILSQRALAYRRWNTRISPPSELVRNLAFRNLIFFPLKTNNLAYPVGWYGVSPPVSWPTPRF